MKRKRNPSREADRARYLREALAAAKAGRPLREIVALCRAAGRIRPLTQDEGKKVIRARNTR
jgi:hypothetical protein